MEAGVIWVTYFNLLKTNLLGQDAKLLMPSSGHHHQCNLHGNSTGSLADPQGGEGFCDVWPIFVASGFNPPTEEWSVANMDMSVRTSFLLISSMCLGCNRWVRDRLQECLETKDKPFIYINTPMDQWSWSIYLPICLWMYLYFYVSLFSICYYLWLIQWINLFILLLFVSVVYKTILSKEAELRNYGKLLSYGQMQLQLQSRES